MKRTRSQFAAESSLFRTACRLAGLAPSRHQAKRWREGQGMAYSYLLGAKALLRDEEAAVRFPIPSADARSNAAAAGSSVSFGGGSGVPMNTGSPSDE